MAGMLGQDFTSRCETPDTNKVNDIMQGLFTLGTFGSFIPMMVSVWMARSSRGISVPTMFLINLSNFLQTLGVLLQNWQPVTCCVQGKWSAIHCLQPLLPAVLVASALIGSFIVFILVVVYYDPGHACETQSQASSVTTKSYNQALLERDGETHLSGKEASRFFWGFIALMIADIAIAVVLLIETGMHSTALKRFADVNNLGSGGLQVMSWVPQIVHTYKMKDRGNLSILTLLIQAPGSGALVVMLLIAGQNWTACFSFGASFVCISTLAIECIYFELRNRRKERARRAALQDPNGDDDDEDGGTVPAKIRAEP